MAAISPFFSSFINILQKSIRFLRKLFSFVAICFLILFLLKTYSFFTFLCTGDFSKREQADIEERKNYLLFKLTKQKVGPRDMPSFLPEQFQGEWAIVSYSMTGLALVNLALRYPKQKAQHIRSLRKIIQRVLDKDIQSFDSKRWQEKPLDSLKDPKNGHIGYFGHLGMLLAGMHILQGQNDQEHALYKSVVTALIKKLNHSPFLLSETYPGEIYIPDNAAVVACIGVFEQLYPQQSKNFAKRWAKTMKDRYLHTNTKLIAFRVRADGSIDQEARGSGVAWSLFYFLYGLQDFAASQHKQLLQHMVGSSLGLTGIKEFEDGNLSGDIDSGPLFFGLSPSGTGFAIAGATYFRNQQLLKKLLFTAEFFGTTIRWNKKRSYLFSPLVGDAIMLAMRTVTPWKK